MPAISRNFESDQFRGHPIIPLSRKKLFKEKSIDRKPAFFG
jgi:hypothetical protein